MHRGRFGGNARKRKAKLTDATFQQMIGAASPAEPQIGKLASTIPVLDDDVAEAEKNPNGVIFEVSQPSLRAAHAREFACQDYRFGYVACQNCRNEQAYYLHHDDLVHGYTFRCRVCRMEMTITAEA